MLFQIQTTIAVSLLFLVNVASGLNHKQLRSLYEQAVNDEKAAETLLLKTENFDNQIPLDIAYRAAAIAFKARYGSSPLNQLGYAKEASSLFNKAIRLDSKNIEIRFLRFAFEHHLPAILDLSEHVKKDRRFIFKTLSHYSENELKKWIANSLKELLNTNHKENQILDQY